MTEKIILCEKDFLAKGGERNCYISPKDYTKVIKIVHRKEKHNEQNKLEYKYYNFLKKNKKPMNHLSECFGFVETNLGLGLVYKRIMNYDNSPSQSFKFFLEKKVFTPREEDELVEELKKYLFKNDILFIDVDLSNVFCQQISKNKFKLIIVDGLGSRRLNWRFYLYLLSNNFTKYKIKKQWKKFYMNFKNTRVIDD